MGHGGYSQAQDWKGWCPRPARAWLGWGTYSAGVTAVILRASTKRIIQGVIEELELGAGRYVWSCLRQRPALSGDSGEVAELPGLRVGEKKTIMLASPLLSRTRGE